MTHSLIQPGFKRVPAGNFVAGPHQGIKVKAFDMKKTPVTNEEFAAVSQTLGPNRYIQLQQNWQTGQISLSNIFLTSSQYERSLQREYARSFADSVNPMTYWMSKEANHQSTALTLGTKSGIIIFLKMVDNPSAQFNSRDGRIIFSRPKQPVVGISYYHAMAWCLLKKLETELEYDLPTDEQYEYIASDRGTKEYGTETGTLFDGERKLAHLDEFENPLGCTVDVDDPRYHQVLPFDIQTTGNVSRWTRFNRFYQSDPFPRIYRTTPSAHSGYGGRGGRWFTTPEAARALVRDHLESPFGHRSIGFSPVIEVP